MQFMIKKLCVMSELAFDETQVKSSADLAYIIHKKLQHFHYFEPQISTVYLTQVFTRSSNDSEWTLAFESTSPDPEDEPLKDYKPDENV